MDSSIGPDLPIHPFQKPNQGREGYKKDPVSEDLHRAAHNFCLDLIRKRSSHSAVLKRLGIIMFVAESSLLPKDIAKEIQKEVVKLHEDFFFCSKKEPHMIDDLDQLIIKIKGSDPKAKIIALIDELFYDLVKDPKEGIPKVSLEDFERIMKPVEEKLYYGNMTSLYLTHIAKRLDDIRADLQIHSRQLGGHLLHRLEDLSREVQESF